MAASSTIACAEGRHPLEQEFPRLDVSRSSIDLAEIKSGGVPRDAIPAILAPEFRPASEITDLADDEPVIFLSGSCGAFAFPYRILIWHEIVHHDQCGRPVAVTYCPLCNTSMVFDRRVDGTVLTFGTTGRLRHSDLVMYDHQTQSFWQQFTGEAIVGAYTGTTLDAVPARIEAWRLFRGEFPDGRVLVPPASGQRLYGANPYVGYDRAPAPFLFDGELPDGVDPMARVVRIGSHAWSLEYVRENTPVLTSTGLRIEWREGQSSVLDSRRIERGRDIGNVRVTRDGEDVAFSVDFAFAFRAFYPDGEFIK
ncbi:DUF3179 domain-containing protein [Parasphingopyxis algicola]|uniref:DUF3179 domain-containing protein n=1 Tax=Parasphingopyxis algicola TaxID=2026624 RepID=UPI001C40AA01|nr:DUF3179 domain-containing protein [Parasphingopyxis algicola]